MQTAISEAMTGFIEILDRLTAASPLSYGMFDFLEPALDTLLTCLNTIQYNNDPDGNRNRYRINAESYKRQYNFGDSQ